MTINEAHNYFKLEQDKTSSLELPSFEQEEIDYWLDDSILRFVKQRYSGQNVKGESFEQSQKRIDDLRTLVSEDSILTSSGSGSYINSETFDLTTITDYLFSLREDAEITYSGTTSRVGVFPITHDAVNIKLDDPFSEHNISFNTANPLRLFVGDYIILIGDGNYTIDSIRLSYIKEPMKVALSPTGSSGTADRSLDYPDLTDQVMQEIVKMAANSALENIESQRYQTHSAEVIQAE